MAFIPTLAVRVTTAARSILREALAVYVTLLKVLIPAMVLVRLMQEWGLVGVTAELLAPLMMPLELPAVLSIVWATTAFTNIYTGLVVYFSLGTTEPLTTLQVTALGGLLLLSHSIPVEGAVAKRLGVPWWSTLLLRVVGAWVFAWLMVVVANALNIWQQPAVELIRLVSPASSWSQWLFDQIKALIMIFFFIAGLLWLLRMLRLVKLDVLLHWLMTPVLLCIGASRTPPKRQLSEMTLVGLTMGLTFGAGLLIRQRECNVITDRESRVVGDFLGVCHGLVDDTLLILIIGAKLSGVLAARVAFAILVVALLTRISDFFYRPPTVAGA